MKVVQFRLPDDMAALEALASQEGVDIVSKHFLPGGQYDRCYVFYEFSQETLSEERHRLQDLVALARQVKDDPGYTGLKNAKQRELYLLHHFGIQSRDAANVIELMKEEMGSLLSSPPAGVTV